jgi:hypothetical protein
MSIMFSTDVCNIQVAGSAGFSPGFTKTIYALQTRVYENPYVSFTIHPDFPPGFCSRYISRNERAANVPLNKA